MDWDSITINGVTLSRGQVYAVLSGTCLAFFLVIAVVGIVLFAIMRKRADE